MKAHSIEFKDKIKNMGREIRAVISYGQTVLEEEIYSITPLFEANLLKSVMKQLDLELSVEIPLNTVINCQIGLLINEDYEMLDFGNYVVYKVEKQEDTNIYKITCYDKMLYAMKQNEELNVEYPITIKNYLNALGEKIGLEVADSNFYNYNMQIQTELYVGLDYTYRDILDEIAQATGSMIIINNEDKLEVKYPTETNDTIDEEFLKDINVEFGEKYGPINAVVLSRAGESDNVYIKDDESIEQNGLCEIKIKDNQIMNFNNRSDFLQGILDALDGLEYYINDFSSTGIMYYDVGDFYNIQIAENSYKCLMLNDEIDISSGIEELIHTDMPEQSETDYTKADKTDMRINQTYLIVDKQNQTIEGVVTNVGKQNEKIAKLRVDVDELSSSISDFAGVTVYGESQEGNVNIENVNMSEPVMIKLHPLGQNISYLYPNVEQYPSNGMASEQDFPLYMTTRNIKFERYQGNQLVETIRYELPDDLLFYDVNTYDEFYLDYESQTCQITKRCKYNALGEVEPLDTEQTKTYTYPTILLNEGDYIISIEGLNPFETRDTYLYVKLMAKNIYTDQFATRAEVSSSISQTAQNINLSVDAKLTNYTTTTDMNSAINLKANEITSQVSQTYETKSNANTNYSRLTQTANSIQSQVANNTDDISTINQTIDEVEINVGKKYNTSDFTNAKITAKINDGTSNVQISANKISLAGKTIDMTSQDISINSTNFKVDKNGNMTCNNATINNATLQGNSLDLTPSNQQYAAIRLHNPNNTSQYASLNWYSLEIGNNTNYNGYVTQILNDGTQASLLIQGGGEQSVITPSRVVTPRVVQTSLEEKKKNFEKFENALNIINQIDVYKYNMKTEKDEDKKHIGFVIGKDFKYSKEVTSKENDGVDIYSFVSVCCKAIQEQQEQIEKLQEKINKLEGGK